MSSSLRTFRAELHVHTVLSPCAEVEMIPPLIVQQAIENQINIIAITDHNATANIRAVQKAALGTKLTVLAGMELQTIEEVHSLCLFEDVSQAEIFQKIVSQALPPIKNQPEHFGEQFVVDETGDFICREEQLLIASTDITLSQAWRFVTELGGLFIPAHVNRKAFGLIENLGFIPTDIPLLAVEISRHLNSHAATSQFPQLEGFTLLKGGDAHRLDEFLGANEFFIEAPSIKEIKLALSSQKGRNIRIID